ncbi:alpha/beta hydrolase family protein [Mangrovitalea sediminis]|uniref:alpha/beta hydrolase family protein n=1 Tax=Mangrovitalea sediminis TaxID=1982043 RepID=UPI000BE4DF15|nr:alpha/beta fold hydrolase [Mangrovitalea sediminis]
MSQMSVRICTPGGYEVPLTWFPGEETGPVILFMAALGVPARFYRPIAQALSANGFCVALMEQRGHGDSALRPGRRSDWGFRAVLENDLPAVMAWVRKQAPGAPLYLMGHSLGGHYAAITAGLRPNEVDGVILVACGTPWWRAFDGGTKVRIRLLIGLLPVCHVAFGYYPGDRLGFGGREARTLMKDWRALAQTNHYSATGVSQDLDAAIGSYGGPVLAIGLADDDFAPAAAVAAVTMKFCKARVENRVIDQAMLGDRADHFRWARTPSAVVEVIRVWADGG